MIATNSINTGAGAAFLADVAAEAPTALEFFATDEAVAVLEAQLETATGPERVHALVAMAWQMRQRDTRRALALVDESEGLLASAGLHGHEYMRVRARLQLIRGEAKWLFGDLVAGKDLAESALKGFGVTTDGANAIPADPLGCADVHWLLAWLAIDQGDGVRRDTELQAMVTAVSASDTVRATVAQAVLARAAAFLDVADAQAQWGTRLELDSETLHPAAACWVEEFWGIVASLSSDHVQSIRHRSKTFDLAVASGQQRCAITATGNLGAALDNLNDHHAALEWLQRGLELARHSGWPSMIGGALMQTARPLHLLQRFDAAADLLHEALALMAPLAASRNYAVALLYLAGVELDRGHYASALDSFLLLEERARALGAADLQSEVKLGQAKALVALGQPEHALHAAQGVLAVTKLDASRQIAALRIMADIHGRCRLPPPVGMTDGTAALHYQRQALAVAATIKDYTIPSDLLEMAAREYAKMGNTAKAYELALQAIQAREKIHSQKANNRVSALQVGFETDKARAESEHQRQLAQAHAERASTLEQANATLEQLGAIGLDITGNLDANAIMEALDRHVHALLDATAFVIYRLDGDGLTLKTVFGVEAGQAVPAHTIRLDDPERQAALCGRKRQEIISEVAPGLRSAVPGTLQTQSGMFAPLLVGERLLGVMTIQSVKPHAYAEREVAIFRTLCAYGAIALANAQAQAQMIQAEKMASLGQLVANVAHEINTPIGAIKSSGGTIVEAMADALTHLPKAMQLLEPAMQSLLMRLIQQASAAVNALSTREERALKRTVVEQLQTRGVDDAADIASLLVQLQAHTELETYLPLLQHPQRAFILETASTVGTIIKSAHNINTAVERVAKIVFALKSFSRVDNNGEMQRVDITEGLETVLTIYHNQIKQGTELVRQFETIPPFPCLPDELNQVWTNLIHNALQAMKNQGTLTVGVRQQDSEVVVSVADTGCGIPEANRSRIFDPFFTTKPTGEGSGLGLDIVKKIVEKHQGRIEVQSAVGVGTTFWVYLPKEGTL